MPTVTPEQRETGAANTPLPSALIPPPVPLRERSGSRMLAVILAALLVAVFIADYIEPEYLHVGILFNVCIALSLWSWRPSWVLLVTGSTLALRLTAHGLDVGLNHDPADLFNLVVGLLVQTLTGTLIWRQVWVQHRLEAEQENTRRHASALSTSLTRTQQAAAEAERATERERAARLREVEARRRERQALHALERVKDLSAALSRAVLPEIPPEIAGGRLRLCARYAPAERDVQIGGDFYDLIALDESQTRYGLVIGDVAGHGVEAAAQTALVTTTLRACVFESEDGPAGVLSRAARTLEGQMESFVSLVYGVYDAEAQTLTYACAGHEPPILVDSPCGPPIPLKPTGPILGVGISDFQQVCLPLRSGQTLVLLTDGLTEVRRGAGEMLDWEGVAEIAARQASASSDPACIADGLLDDVRAWAGAPRLADDVALLVARVA